MRWCCFLPCWSSWGLKISMTGALSQTGLSRNRFRARLMRAMCAPLPQKLEPCPVCQRQWREGEPAGGSAPDLDGAGDDGAGGRPRARRARGQAPRRPMSEEHRASIRAALAGRKRRPLEEDHKRSAPVLCCPWSLLLNGMSLWKVHASSSGVCFHSACM